MSSDTGQSAQMTPGTSTDPAYAGPAQPSALSSFGNSLIHGQGQSTPQQQLVATVQGQQLKQMDPSDPQYQQLQQSYQNNMSPDSGGYLGSLMRAVTGSGQNVAEQALGGGLQAAMALYRQQQAKTALQNSNQNMMNWGNQFSQNASNQLGANIGQKF